MARDTDEQQRVIREDRMRKERGVERERGEEENKGFEENSLRNQLGFSPFGSSPSFLLFSPKTSVLTLTNSTNNEDNNKIQQQRQQLTQQRRQQLNQQQQQLNQQRQLQLSNICIYFIINNMINNMTIQTNDNDLCNDMTTLLRLLNKCNYACGTIFRARALTANRMVKAFFSGHKSSPLNIALNNKVFHRFERQGVPGPKPSRFYAYATDSTCVDFKIFENGFLEGKKASRHERK
ncbi:hypothetical protein MTR_3g451950 [Medicago truncatula]|uniref:Uncharacterized protein n=1 Tax=Medicago truncatula TaxID=3880 RepID=A0A072UVV3_MEDTR|nr:hypothetical protein MTR_3g451950 [Medicago truncatula]